MLGRNVSLTGETKIMFMGSSSTEIIFHISATAWALWGSKSDFLLPVPMGNIMGKKTDWIVREMAWRSCGRLFLCLGVLLLCAYIIKTGSTREGKRRQNKNVDVSVNLWMRERAPLWESQFHASGIKSWDATNDPRGTMGQLTSTTTSLVWTHQMSCRSYKE